METCILDETFNYFERIKKNMQEQTSVATSNNTLLKDLLIPISIVIAGAFVGAGLYFSGNPTTGTGDQAVVAPKEIDNTDKVNPVTADDHIRGSLEAPIKIVEYSDFDCPFCERFHGVMKNITEKYSGDEVAWVYRQFPLEQLHPDAPGVSLASECVAELSGNEAFWNFADAYLDARGTGNTTKHSDLLLKIVGEIGLDKKDFSECVSSGRLKEAVQADVNNAVETGGRGTPWSILIGPSGKTYPINGSLPQSTIEQMIELAKKEA